jgi:NADPH-dependent curcumin reductase CurA
LSTLPQEIADGQLVVREDILEGLEAAPRGLIGLLHGENIGKRMVRVAPEPQASAQSLVSPSLE